MAFLVLTRGLMLAQQDNKAHRLLPVYTPGRGWSQRAGSRRLGCCERVQGLKLLLEVKHLHTMR